MQGKASSSTEKNQGKREKEARGEEKTGFCRKPGDRHIHHEKRVEPKGKKKKKKAYEE